MLLSPAERRVLIFLILLLTFGYVVDLVGIRPVVEIPRERLELPPIEESPFLQGKVDLNKAGNRALESLPGIGPAMAERILEYRSKSGPFKSIQDLLDIRGVGPKTLKKPEPHIAISVNSPPDSGGSF